MLQLLDRRARAVLAGGLLVIAGSTAALAATPSSGEVSKAKPRVEWTGSVINSYANRIPVLVTEDDTFPCLPQSCDMFALKVVESDDLTITADAPEGSSTDGSSGTQVTLRIRKPDGSVSVHTSDASGVSPEKPLTVKIKKAPAGDYEIEYFNYYLATAGAIEYKGTATLGSPITAPVGPSQPPHPVSPSPQPGGGTQPNNQPGGNQQQAIDLSVKTGKLSAKKLKKGKKLAATVTVNREVQSVTGTLKKGKKVVGKGKLGRVQKSAKLSLKLSKALKKGTYSLTVAASDGAGSNAIKTVKVKVGK